MPRIVYIVFTICAALIATIANPAFTQNQITGHVQSVPSQSNAHARVSFDGLQVLTNSSSGDFSLTVPSGTHTNAVETPGNFRFEQTATVPPTTYSYQTIQALGISSNTKIYYTSILDVVKNLTGTMDGAPSTVLLRWPTLPVHVYARRNNPSDPHSMPTSYAQYFDGTIADFQTKTEMTLFDEQSNDVTEGITFIYVPNNQVPFGLDAATIEDADYGDGDPATPKHYTVTVGNGFTLSAKLNHLFRRELMRALDTYNYSSDPQFIQYSNASSPTTLDSDEGQALQIIYSLQNRTDMANHLNTVVDEGVLPITMISLNLNLLPHGGRFHVKIDWSTLSEIHNYGFEVQKDTLRPHQTFESIRGSFTAGHGTTNLPQTYSFVDSSAVIGAWSYRLKQIDLDGTISFSETREVTVTAKGLVEDVSPPRVSTSTKTTPILSIRRPRFATDSRRGLM